ncbi:carbohydrate ABC transporter permease [Sphaerochaeta sp. PS]|uniref:carbohydrate ABC transporter permease n=1 Tax=Sphaerochaeta sp. PS TaxID=3076336 RepID=UPI0028A3A548|nr:carbohydrate ABC transporter permease [Sphaerochaeta sp. PS]MDT4762579.1 carbohydrate ABC transporter permease [Sphaerochaeta sp. PS]
MNYRIKRHLGNLGRTLILTFFLLLVVMPIYWMAITSFKTNTEIINAQEVTYYPHEFTTDNYSQLFRLYDYKGMLFNSLIVSISTGLSITMLSIFGGYGLARYAFRGKDSMLLFFLITQMIPGILVIIPLYVIFSKLGLINTRLSLFFFYLISNLPFCVITMRSFFERIPYSLEEAAYVDGCSKMGTLWKIILPVMFPGIVAVFVFAFIGAWNELIAGTIFINTSDLWTVPVGLKSLIGKYDVKWGVLMAGGMGALLPTAIMFAFMQKFVVEGLTAGAVKG